MAILESLFFMSAAFVPSRESTYHNFCVILFITNFSLFGLLDQYIRRRAAVQYSRSCFYLFVTISSSLGAVIAWYKHETLCDLTDTYINLSAFFQVLALAAKSLFDLDYLKTYGTLKVKII